MVPPERAAALTRDYQDKLALLWHAALQARPGEKLPEVVPLPAEDRRFRGAAWREQPFHSLLLQSYLLHAGYLAELAAAATLPPEDRRRLQFMTRQYVDAMSPSNFPATNPDVVARALETEGESLASGARNLLADLRRGRISMSEHAAFEVGRNLAVTPGSVVFRNELVEVIQYRPTTPTVHARPLVIIPPCINKYYILDLQPSNSFVRHAVAEGFTTFVASWRNIPPALAHLQLGRLPRRRRVRGVRRGQRTSPAAARSTRSASASAGRCSPVRWRRWPRAATRRWRARRSSRRCSTSPTPARSAST